MAGHTKVGNPKLRRRLKRKVSVRLRLSGTAERPRLSVFRSAKHIYAQAVDDVTGRILAASSDLEAGVKAAIDGKHKKERARLVGKVIGEKLLGLKVEAVVFDRNGFMFHGRVKEVADGAREAGLKF
jgi:large subunit ribosomal protein L18